MRLLFALAWCTALAQGGCPQETLPDGGLKLPTSFADACEAVSGARFASLDKGECGLCPNGMDCTCTWHVTFSGTNQWAWQHSDYGMSGTFTCTGHTQLNVDSNPSWAIPATYDPATDLLTWDGVLYRRE